MAYTTIDKPTDYFNTVLYTGTGSSQDISVGFQTDWTWIKDRDSTENHNIFDTVRTATKRISSNRNNTEDTQAQQLTAFGSNGFTVGTDSGANHSGRDYVSWNWLAGGSASSNSDGSVTSTVSVNSTAGFSVSKYTGTGSNLTFGHGLGAVPDWFMIKNLDVDQAWRVYHKSMGFSKRLVLSETGAESTSAVGLNGDPTSSLINLDNSTGCTNASGQDFICYAFAEKKGYSKFGSYVANGNTDGTFVYLGFKPAFIIGKITTDLNEWFLMDSTRDTFNVANKSVYPNTNGAENTNHDIDFLSNGFKIRDSDGTVNASGNTYIYMAFAENPFVSSGGIPCTAR